MKVFLSSLIGGFKEFRDAAADAVTTLGHTPVRAEDFGASPASAQQACLAGVRDADVAVLILGERYGHPQASGLSATHEEYREARDIGPVLVFIQSGTHVEPAQAAFIAEVQGWENGHYTANFETAEELRTKVTRGLHDHLLANEAAPLDEQQLVERARLLLPDSHGSGSASLGLAIAGGPSQAPSTTASADARSPTSCGLLGSTIFLTQTVSASSHARSVHESRTHGGSNIAGIWTTEAILSASWTSAEPVARDSGLLGAQPTAQRFPPGRPVTRPGHEAHHSQEA